MKDSMWGCNGCDEYFDQYDGDFIDMTFYCNDCLKERK